MINGEGPNAYQSVSLLAPNGASATVPIVATTAVSFFITLALIFVSFLSLIIPFAARYSNSSVTGHEAAGFLSVAWQPPTPPTKNPVTFTVYVLSVGFLPSAMLASFVA